MISIIIPVYNADSTVENTVQSVLNQSYQDIEIILVNDGSKDDSLNKCRALEQRNSSIKVINQGNQGAAVARNHGINEANGEWIMFVDADDFLPPRAVDMLMENATNDTDIIAGCYCESIPYNKSTGVQKVESSLFAKAALFPEKYAVILQKRLGESQGHREVCIGAPWGKLFRRNFLVKNGIKFPEKIMHHEDTLFCLKAFLKTESVTLIDADVYCYIRSEDSVTKRFNPNRVADMLFVIHISLEELGNIDKEFNEAIKYFIIFRCVDCIKGNITHVKNQYTFSENVQQIKTFLKDPEIKSFFACYKISNIFFNPYLHLIEKLLLILEKYRQVQLIIIGGRLLSHIKRIKNEKNSHYNAC